MAYVASTVGGDVPSQVFQYPNSLDVVESSDGWQVEERFALIFMKGVNNGHISFVTAVGDQVGQV